MTDQQNAALEPCKLCGRPARIGSGYVKCSAAFDRDDGPECEVARWWVTPETWQKLHAPAGAEAVREALLKYGGHRKRCEYHKRPRGRACSCGWDAIVHALPTALATPQPAPTAAGCPDCRGETIPDGYNAGRFVHEEGCPKVDAPPSAHTAAEDGLREAFAWRYKNGRLAHIVGLSDSECRALESAKPSSEVEP